MPKDNFMWHLMRKELLKESDQKLLRLLWRDKRARQLGLALSLCTNEASEVRAWFFGPLVSCKENAGRRWKL